MQPLFALSLGIAAMVFAANQVHAQSADAPGLQCAPRDQVVQVLASRYGEKRRSMGLAADEQLMELYASAAGTWSLTVTTAQGITCLVASGDSFESVPEPLALNDQPA